MTLLAFVLLIKAAGYINLMLTEMLTFIKSREVNKLREQFASKQVNSSAIKQTTCNRTK